METEGCIIFERVVPRCSASSAVVEHGLDTGVPQPRWLSNRARSSTGEPGRSVHGLFLVASSFHPFAQGSGTGIGGTSRCEIPPTPLRANVSSSAVPRGHGPSLSRETRAWVACPPWRGTCAEWCGRVEARARLSACPAARSARRDGLRNEPENERVAAASTCGVIRRFHRCCC